MNEKLFVLQAVRIWAGLENKIINEWFVLQLLKFLLSCVALVVMPDEDHQNLVKTVNIY